MSCDSSFEDLKIFYYITLAAAAAGDAAVWALSDRYENPDSWGLFWKVWTAGCELMCVSKIWPFHLDKKCGTIHYLLRWPLQNDPKCVTQYHQKCRRVIRIGILWRWLIYGALSQKCAYNSCWLLPYGLFTRCPIKFAPLSAAKGRTEKNCTHHSCDWNLPFSQAATLSAFQ